MIIDKLENANKYYSFGENFKKGFEFLKNTDLANLPQGKHIIDTENVWANLQIAESREESDALFEIHRKYVDIQYVISGSEKMLWTNVENFIPVDEFDISNDIQFGTTSTDLAFASLIVKEGYFVIFTPDDAHKPLLKIKDEQFVKKIVLKIAM